MLGSTLTENKRLRHVKSFALSETVIILSCFRFLCGVQQEIVTANHGFCPNIFVSKLFLHSQTHTCLSVSGGTRVVTEVLVCWDRDGGRPNERMILCGGSAGGDERVKGSGVGRPLG